MSALQLKFGDDEPWIIEQKIFNLLNDYVQPSSTKSVFDTAHALDSIFPIHRRDEANLRVSPGNNLAKINMGEWVKDMRPVREAVVKKYRSKPGDFDFATWRFFSWAIGNS